MMADALEAENAVVGSILIDPRCLRAVEELLEAEDFGSAANRAIYQAARTLARRGEAVDPVLIRRQTEADGRGVPGEYLLELMDTTPTAANVEAYARLAREQAHRRSLLALAEEIKTRTLEGDDPTQVLEGALEGENRRLQRTGEKALLGPEELALGWMDHRQKVESGSSRAFVPTGFRELDGILGGGLIASGMHVLAARPGMGKTTLALNIAERVAKRVGPVLFVSLEMDHEQITAKRIACASGLPAHRLLMDDLNEEECERMCQAMEQLHRTPLYVNGKPSATLGDITAMARTVKGVRLVVIDYLGKISPDSKNSRASRYEYTTEISGEVKVLARTLKVPVLVLCQINREAEKRPDKRPNLSDLRDSGAVEQDADTVLFLHRKDYYAGHPQGEDTGPFPTQVMVAKNRHGRTGECVLAMYAHTSKFITVRPGRNTSGRAGVGRGSNCKEE